MKFEEFISRGDQSCDIPEWFTVNPNDDTFMLVPPYEEKKKVNFSIDKHRGCLPYFETKVAGVTKEGRDIHIRKAMQLLTEYKGTKTVLTPKFRLEKDSTNLHHANAIKVMMSLKSGKEEVMKERCVGFIPARLANFIRFANEHEIDYYVHEVSDKTKIKTSSAWVSITLYLCPDTISKTTTEELTPDEPPKRIPVVKKTITGTNINDFRQALLSRKKRNK